MKKLLLLPTLIAFFAALFLTSCDELVDRPEKSTPPPLTIFLVRHAEKADASRDPALSPAGKARALALSWGLRDAKIDQIHTTDYTRTRDTAAPTAKLFETELKIYDPSKLPALVASLRKSGGRHLVVGHSNTTPAMVKLLGGDPGAPIKEKTEFDRLYIVTGEEKNADTVLLRYGP